MPKVVEIKPEGKHETYDIWNREKDVLNGEGNFIIDDIIVHNSILENGVRRFEDLLLLNGLGHPGPMQCVRSDSKINTENGLKDIDKLDPTKDRIMVYDGEKVIFTDSYKVQEQGKKEIYKIKLENGTEIFVSGLHAIQTEQGFVEASNLKPGQNVLIHRESKKEA